MNTHYTHHDLAALVNTMTPKLNVANEDMGDGVVRQELEAVWYGKVSDFSQLEKATGTEVQRQSAIMAPNGIVRVRKSTVKGEVKYVLTSKSFIAGGGRKEVGQDVSEGMHAVFMMAVGTSMDKTRYTFDAGNGLTWEVDIFTDLDGNNKPWCKIDLEYEERPKEWPPLPIQLTEIVGPDNRTPEQIEFVKQLNNIMFQNKVY